MTDSITDILSGKDAPAPEPERIVDEPEAIVGTELDTPVQTLPEERPQAAKPQPEVKPEGPKTVPLEALQEERGKVKRYTEEVAEFRRAQAEQAAQIARMNALLEQRQQQQEKPDFYENPEHATRQFVAPQFEQINQQLLAIAKDTAIGRFTEEKVDEAERAFLEAMQTQRLDPADYQKVVGSPNRYAAAVQWHRRQVAQAEIGDDPAAYREKVEAEIRAKLGLAPDAASPQQTRAQQPPAVMPTNFADVRNAGARNGSTWSGNPPMGDILATVGKPKSIFK